MTRGGRPVRVEGSLESLASPEDASLLPSSLEAAFCLPGSGEVGSRLEDCVKTGSSDGCGGDDATFFFRPGSGDVVFREDALRKTASSGAGAPLLRTLAGSPDMGSGLVASSVLSIFGLTEGAMARASKAKGAFPASPMDSGEPIRSRIRAAASSVMKPRETIP